MSIFGRLTEFNKPIKRKRHRGFSLIPPHLRKTEKNRKNVRILLGFL